MLYIINISSIFPLRLSHLMARVYLISGNIELFIFHLMWIFNYQLRWIITIFVNTLILYTNVNKLAKIRTNRISFGTAIANVVVDHIEKLSRDILSNQDISPLLQYNLRSYVYKWIFILCLWTDKKVQPTLRFLLPLKQQRFFAV